MFISFGCIFISKLFDLHFENECDYLRGSIGSKMIIYPLNIFHNWVSEKGSFDPSIIVYILKVLANYGFL